MWDEELQRHLRVTIIDEETGESIATATGVDTVALIIAPDTLRDGAYRRIIIGDMLLLEDMLTETLEDVMVWNGNGAMIDLSHLLEDLLAEAVRDLPIH